MFSVSDRILIENQSGTTEQQQSGFWAELSVLGVCNILF